MGLFSIFKNRNTSKLEKIKVDEVILYNKATSFKVVGVTFKNKDGESRQEILDYLYSISHKKRPVRINAELESYTYKGDPALSVIANGYQVGNIAASYVNKVEKLLPKLIDAELKVDRFYPNDDSDKVVYSAEVVLYT